MKAQPDIKTSARRCVCVCSRVTKHKVIHTKLGNGSLNSSLFPTVIFTPLFVYFDSRVTEVAFILILLSVLSINRARKGCLLVFYDSGK